MTTKGKHVRTFTLFPLCHTPTRDNHEDKSKEDEKVPKRPVLELRILRVVFFLLFVVTVTATLER